MRIFVLLCCLLAALSAHAQLLRTTPAFITETSSSITIFADATKGNKGIINVTGDIFVHIGAITSLSTSSSNWKYVPVSWGVADNKVKCTKLANNVWSFTINGGLRDFFGMTNASETIQKIVGHKGKIIWDSSKPDGTPKKLMDSSKFRSLGWSPRIDLETGIKSTYTWFLENQHTFKQLTY